jgi:hypothetical protein
MVARSLALCLTLAALSAVAQSNNFILLSHGKPCGKASYSLEKTKNGYKIKSKVNYHLSHAAGTLDPDPTPDPVSPTPQPASGAASSGSYAATPQHGPASPSLPASSIPGDRQFIQEYKLDAEGTYDGGFMMDMVTQLNTSYTPDKAREKLDIILNAEGHQQLEDPIPIKPNYIFLPNYDPSAMQALLIRATAHPAEKDLYLVVVPGYSKDKEPIPALWLTNQPDAHGTLDGKPVTLHHYVLRLYKSEYDLFADDTNTLMMGTSSTLSAIYNRENFVLTAVK